MYVDLYFFMFYFGEGHWIFRLLIFPRSISVVRKQQGWCRRYNPNRGYSFHSLVHNNLY